MGEWCGQNGYALIATKFEVANDVFTGKIEGKNCYGKEKERRIENLIKTYIFNQSYDYGDSKSDLYFLHKTHFIHYGSLQHKKEYLINDEQESSGKWR